MPQNSNLRFYEEFAGVYESLYAQVDEHAAVERWLRLLEDLGLIPLPASRLRFPPTMVDLGCGPGRHLVAWHRCGFRPIGLDGSPAMLSAAKRNTQSAGIRCPLILCNILDLGRTPAIPPCALVASHLFFPNLFPTHQLGSLTKAISELLMSGGIWIGDWRADLVETPTSSEAVDIGGVVWNRRNSFDSSNGAFVQFWSTKDRSMEERFWNHELPQIEMAAAGAGLRVICKKHFAETPASITLVFQKSSGKNEVELFLPG